MGKAEEAATATVMAIAGREGGEEEGGRRAGAGVGVGVEVRDDEEETPRATNPVPIDAIMLTEVADDQQAAAAAAAGGAAAAAPGSHPIPPHRPLLAGMAEKAGEREAARRGATLTTS